MNINMNVNESNEISMHSTLTVAVIAMNNKGEYGAASTLGKENVHRGQPYFPLMVLQDDIVSSRGADEFGLL